MDASCSRISEWCRWLSRSYAQSSNQLGSCFELAFGFNWTDGCITDVSDLSNLTLSINCQRYSWIKFRPFADNPVNWNTMKQSSTSNAMMLDSVNIFLPAYQCNFFRCIAFIRDIFTYLFCKWFLLIVTFFFFVNCKKQSVIFDTHTYYPCISSLFILRCSSPSWLIIRSTVGPSKQIYWWPPSYSLLYLE